MSRATSVSAAATSPPVSDSAAATVWPFAVSRPEDLGSELARDRSGHPICHELLRPGQAGPRYNRTARAT